MEETVGDVVRKYMERKGWSQADLARVIGKTTAAVNEILNGKRGISPEVAALFGAAFDTEPSFWLALQSAQLKADEAVSATKRRSHVYELAPIREMVRRGWIIDTDSILSLEDQLRVFFRVECLDDAPQLSLAMRKSDTSNHLTPSHLAWCCRARNLADDLIVHPFDRAKIDECLEKLRPMMAYPSEARKVALLLGDYGIRFVIVEHLQGSRIDGASMWLDVDRPVIALSLRMNRIDSFWFTLFHELSHIKNEDGLSVDTDLTGENAIVESAAKSPIERRADNDAAALLVPQEELLSFIQRVGPLYSKSRIVQFSHAVKVHPGIVVGQLRYRGEIPYRANAEMMAKIRDKVAASSLTDGWGHTVN